MKLDRRAFTTGLLSLPALAVAGRAARAEELGCTKFTMNEDGLHVQPWFVQDSFLDMKEELQAANKEGKRLLVIMEAKGCPYCEKMHKVHFTMPEICSYVRKHFRVLQLNKLGAREVTDFDGTTMPENKWLVKYRAFFTPNLMFFDDDVERVVKNPMEKRIVARSDGPMPPDVFLEMFRYVKDKGYEKGGFIQYVRSRKDG